MKVGLTGNIAAGKSEVARVLVGRGWDHIDTDELARKAVEPGQPGLLRIVETFGEGVLHEDGTLNREALARIVFADEYKRKKLNAITHPVIAQWVAQGMAAARGNVVVSVPLLFEAGMEGFFDEVWLVTAKEKTRLDRLVTLRGMDKEEARARMASQWSQSRKIPLAREVFPNDGSLEDLRRHLAWRLDKRKL